MMLWVCIAIDYLFVGYWTARFSSWRTYGGLDGFQLGSIWLFWPAFWILGVCSVIADGVGATITVIGNLARG